MKFNPDLVSSKSAHERIHVAWAHVIRGGPFAGELECVMVTPAAEQACRGLVFDRTTGMRTSCVQGLHVALDGLAAQKNSTDRMRRMHHPRIVPAAEDGELAGNSVVRNCAECGDERGVCLAVVAAQGIEKNGHPDGNWN